MKRRSGVAVQDPPEADQAAVVSAGAVLHSSVTASAVQHSSYSYSANDPSEDRQCEHVVRGLRLGGEPADALILPQLGDLGALDYHRAAESIEEGRAAAKLMLPQIRQLLGS